MPFLFTVTTTCPGEVLISADNLPKGLSLTDNVTSCTATVSGKALPHQDGAHAVTLNASSGLTVPATQVLTITVGSPPSLRAAAAITAKVGVPFTSHLTASGYPIPTIGTSPLPAGVSLGAGTNGSAVLAGTPSPGAGGTYLVTITASNGVAVPATQPLHLTIIEAPTITSAPASVPVTAAVPMAPVTVTAAGYPIPTISASGLPAGLSLVDHLNGMATLAGTPAGAGGRSITATLRARNHAGTSTQQLVLSISP